MPAPRAWAAGRPKGKSNLTSTWPSRGGCDPLEFALVDSAEDVLDHRHAVAGQMLMADLDPEVGRMDPRVKRTALVPHRSSRVFFQTAPLLFVVIDLSRVVAGMLMLIRETMRPARIRTKARGHVPPLRLLAL